MFSELRQRCCATQIKHNTAICAEINAASCATVGLLCVSDAPCAHNPTIMLLVAKHGSSTTSLVQLWLGGCKATADGAVVRYRDKQQRGNLHA